MRGTAPVSNRTFTGYWMPAFAGMTAEELLKLAPMRTSGDDAHGNGGTRRADLNAIDLEVIYQSTLQIAR